MTTTEAVAEAEAAMFENQARRNTIFQKVYRGLRAQGFERSMDKSGVGCAFRGRGFRKCAVGMLIPDELYKPECESFALQLLLDRHFLPGVAMGDAGLLESLICAHDGGYTPQVMINNLAALAIEYHLTIPANTTE